MVTCLILMAVLLAVTRAARVPLKFAAGNRAVAYDMLNYVSGRSEIVRRSIQEDPIESSTMAEPDSLSFPPVDTAPQQPLDEADSLSSNSSSSSDEAATQELLLSSSSVSTAPQQSPEKVDVTQRSTHYSAVSRPERPQKSKFNGFCKLRKRKPKYASSCDSTNHVMVAFCDVRDRLSSLLIYIFFLPVMLQDANNVMME